MNKIELLEQWLKFLDFVKVHNEPIEEKISNAKKEHEEKFRVHLNSEPKSSTFFGGLTDEWKEWNHSRPSLFGNDYIEALYKQLIPPNFFEFMRWLSRNLPKDE